MNREGRKILGTFDGKAIVPREVEVWANCVRVPSRDGHLEAVTIQLDGKIPSAGEIAEAFSSFTGAPQRFNLATAPRKPIVLRPEDNRPQPILDALAGSPGRARGMAVSIGRIRLDGDLLRFFCLVHNTIRGSAGGSILNAECAIHDGMI